MSRRSEKQLRDLLNEHLSGGTTFVGYCEVLAGLVTQEDVWEHNRLDPGHLVSWPFVVWRQGPGTQDLDSRFGPTVAGPGERAFRTPEPAGGRIDK